MLMDEGERSRKEPLLTDILLANTANMMLGG